MLMVERLTYVWYENDHGRSHDHEESPHCALNVFTVKMLAFSLK
jgi:hypothetical protein